MSEPEIDLSDLSPQEREEWRLNELVDSLFDMFLRFEKAFARKAIDTIGLSDEDATAAAKLFLKGSNLPEASASHAFAYLLGHVVTERMMRELGRRFAMVAGSDEMLSIKEITERYDSLEQAGKIGKT